MEATYSDYVRMGQLVTLTAVILMILHGILLRAAPVKRFVRRRWQYLRLQTQKAPRRGTIGAAALFLTGAALMGVFFWQFFSAMQELLRDEAFGWLKLSLYWIGFMLAMDLTCVGGWMFTASLWTVLSRRKPGWSQSDDM